MEFKIKDLPIVGVRLLTLPIFKDKRGHFLESYSEKINKILNISTNWVQDNESVSKKYVFRGLHFQKGKYAQSKLIRVSNGEIIDIIVDLREKSKTFMKHLNIKLNKSNSILYLPRGIAHGFISLDDNTIVNYKCDNLYNPNSEFGVNPFKSNLKLDFGIDRKKIIITKRDLLFPSLNNSYVFN